MLTALVSTALRLRVLVLAAAVALLVWGIGLADRASFDVFPEFSHPKVEVQTEGPGLSTEEVESLITLPIENALTGTPGLGTLRSKSVQGLSSVELLFEDGTDLVVARQLVGERLSGVAPSLPAVAGAPVILQPLSSTSRAMKIAMWSETLSPLDLTDVARWTVRPRLMAIPGVANVAIWGERPRELQVLVDPERLAAANVSLDELTRAVREAVPLGSGGFVDTANQRLAVRHVPAVATPDDLARAAIPGTSLRIGDVAEVVEGHPPPIGDAVVGDGDYLGPGLLLIVEKHLDGNTLRVSREVEAAMEELRPGLAGVEFDTTVFRPATFIERSLDNLSHALVVGCVLVALVLVLFLFEWRSALISLTAIPLSLLGAAAVLHLSGGTINTMILAGLVIAVGEVVDDAIIDVENIARRMRLNRQLPEPRSAFRVVLDASLEVRSAVVYASLIVVLVFLPVFFLGGLAGAFFRPLAWAYVLAILASLLVALTVTPALCLLLLPGARGPRRDPPLARVLKRGYLALLPPVIARPRLVALALVLALGGTGWATTRLGEAFLPQFQETDFLMHWVEKPGTSLAAMRRITERAGRELTELPGVRNFGSHIGRAEVADEVVGPNFTELWISIDDDVPYRPTIARVQAVVDGYPGLQRDLLTYLRERVKEVLSGTSAALVVRTFGPELGVLRTQAASIANAIEDVPGVADLKVESQTLVPQIDVRLRPERAERFGMSAAAVRGAALTLVKGTTVGQVYEGQRIVDVAVWGTPGLRDDPTSVAALPVRTPGGALAPLAELADVAVVSTPNEIKRERASRRIDVSCNVLPGHDLGEVSRAIEARVRELPFERGYHPEFLGEYAERRATRDRLLSLSLAALAGIFVLLMTDFQAARPAVLVFLTLPFALIGGVGGALFGGGVLSLGSLVGFVTVLGIAARNGILLVSHYRHLEREEGMRFGSGLVLRGAEERLVPILMTALSAALALLPLALGGERPGQEIEHPMALVILGGLVTSTLLNLFLLPALYAAWGRGRSPAPAR